MKKYFSIFLIVLSALILNCAGFLFAQETAGGEDAQAAAATTEQQTGQDAEASDSTEEAAVSPTTTPVLEIKRLETEEPLYSFELRDVDVTDLFRVMAHDYKLNLMVDKDVEGKVTASLTNVSLEEALDTIAESQNLILKKKGNIVRVAPNLITKTFVMKFVEAKKILESSDSTTETASTSSSESTGSLTQASSIYNLLSGKGKIFLGKQPNSITIIDYPPNIEKVEEYVKVIDQRMASRVFKLKYLKANDVVGEASTSGASSTETSSTGTTESETSSSGST